MATGPLVGSYEVMTLMGIINQFQSLAVLNFNPIYNATLNAKHGINANVAPTKIPTIKYFGVGNNGSYNIDDQNGSRPREPDGLNLDLYRKVPFRCVPVANDLSNTERIPYRLRTRETINGADYYCYWLKVLNFVDNEVRVTLVNPQTNAQEAYTIDPANLNPTPTRLSTSDVANANASRIVVSVRATMTILASELIEYNNIYYGGDQSKLKIDEFGCYAGEDRIVSGTNYQGTSFNYTDAIYVTLNKHKTIGNGEDFSNPTKVYNADIVFENGSVLIG